MREFYISYVATLRSSFDRRSNPALHEQITHVQVYGCRVDIYLPTIRGFLYGADTYATREHLTPKFYYKLKVIKATSSKTRL